MHLERGRGERNAFIAIAVAASTIANSHGEHRYATRLANPQRIVDAQPRQHDGGRGNVGQQMRDVGLSDRDRQMSVGGALFVDRNCREIEAQIATRIKRWLTL